MGAKEKSSLLEIIVKDSHIVHWWWLEWQNLWKNHDKSCNGSQEREGKVSVVFFLLARIETNHYKDVVWKMSLDIFDDVLIF